MTVKSKLCGKKAQSTGKPCRWRRPCPYHDKTKTPGKGTKKNRDVLRQEKLIQARCAGKSVKDAGREAGYAESTLEGRIYQIIEMPEYKARIQAHIDAAGLDTNEIIGTLVSQMRLDMAPLFPDDPFWQRASQLGISHLIRRYKRRPVVAGFDKEENAIVDYETEVEGYSAQEGAKHLTKVFGLEQLPAPNQKAQRELEASIERVMQNARERGITPEKMSDAKLRKQIIKKMTPKFQGLVSDASN